jgi:hypothetical protein
MTNHNQPPKKRPSFAEAIQQVRTHDKADFLLASGQVAKLDRTKLLQNYEAILRMAGIEQILAESIGLAHGSAELRIADAKLSRFADVPAYWVLPLGELIKSAAKQRSVPSIILDGLPVLKGLRDSVMHGETEKFGQQTRKTIGRTYTLLLKQGVNAPRPELQARIEAVAKAKADGTGADEMLVTLGTLYQAIEAEVEIRKALKEARVFKGELPLVESIFELMRATVTHRTIFQRDNLAWKFRACALVRNHLVHGTIIVPNSRQTKIISETYALLGQAIAEIRFRKNGGKSSEGDFRNGLDL